MSRFVIVDYYVQEIFEWRVDGLQGDGELTMMVLLMMAPRLCGENFVMVVNIERDAALYIGSRDRECE